MLYAGSLNGFEHFACVGEIQCQRLFAEDVLAVFRSGDGDNLVHIRRGGNVNDVDIVTLHEGFPRGFVACPAELLCRLSDPFLVTAADGLHADFRAAVKEHRQTRDGVRVRLAHEFVANQTEVELFHNVYPFIL